MLLRFWKKNQRHVEVLLKVCGEPWEGFGKVAEAVGRLGASEASREMYRTWMILESGHCGLEDVQ